MCSNDPTFNPKFENNGIVGYRHPTFFTRIKRHPTSEMPTLDDPTGCSNDPTFHPTPMLGEMLHRLNRPLLHRVPPWTNY